LRMDADPFSLTVVQLGEAYRRGELKPTAVTRSFLERIEPGPVYREVLAERALAQAERAERQFTGGVDVGPLQGIPLALKDLLAVKGSVSAAGSRVLAEGEPAIADAPAVARLDAAGAVFLGKTTMTELAFSGVGINPHFGTPPNAFDPDLIPGGSSSGSAVAVASGLASAAVGSDTGGSVRIPAAFNGVIGLKTTEGAVPTDGCVPLSVTLDTVGPITSTPGDAWLLFRALAALPAAPIPALPARLRLLAPTTILQENLAPEIGGEFQVILERLRRLGHEVVESPVPLLAEIETTVARLGSLAAHEAFAIYEELLRRHGPRVDPRVSGRILAASGRSSADYIRLMLARKSWQRAFWQEFSDVDAVVAPTVPILPPPLAELANDDAYFETNRLCLRHTSLFNMLGGACISVPMGDGPMGLMVASAAGNEGLVVAIAELLPTA
jgi:aspartyl-tRNA(Asn)/glutamyl-tRNA(Gln) amidotransferase subunit A